MAVRKAAVRPATRAGASVAAATRTTARSTKSAPTTKRSTTRKTTTKSAAPTTRTRSTSAVKKTTGRSTTKAPRKHVGDVIGLGPANPPKPASRPASRGRRPKGIEISTRGQGRLPQARVTGGSSRR